MTTPVSAAAKQTVQRLKVKLAQVRRERLPDDPEESADDKKRMKNKLRDVAERLKKLTSRQNFN